jgi:short subunit dehydrogenase-like uncharacterized protein
MYVQSMFTLPFRKWGEAVVALCVEHGTSYVDINGEPEFVERMFEGYNDQAIKAGVSIVSCCGFDSVPADMGVAYAESQLKADGIIPHSFDVFLKIKTGQSGMAINYGTYDSLIESLAHIEDLRAFRKDHPRAAVKKIGPKQVFVKSPRWEPRVSSWV